MDNRPDKGGRMKAQTLLNKPPVDWKKIVDRLTTRQRDELASGTGRDRGKGCFPCRLPGRTPRLRWRRPGPQVGGKESQPQRAYRLDEGLRLQRLP